MDVTPYTSQSIGRTGPVAGPAPSGPAPAPAPMEPPFVLRASERVDTVELSVPSTPPEDVMREVRAAGERAERMAEQGRELHFRFDEDSRRVVVEVCDLEGSVLLTIPPSHALAAMAGEIEV